jgi:hypothetical protein
VAFEGSERKDARHPLSGGASNHPPFCIRAW